MQKIHVHNDFDVHLNFDNIKTDYVSRVEFWTRRDDIFCCCKCDGSLKVEDDNNIVCYLNDHNLGTGKLNYNVIFQIPDPNYNDGYKKVCQHYVSDIFLTSENGDTTVAIVKVVGGEEATNLINRLSEFEKVFDNKQDKLAFDTIPTSGSKNVVYSDGIYNAIKNNKPDLSDYAKKTDLEGLATEQWVDDKGYITSIPDDYITESELDSKGYVPEKFDSDNYNSYIDVKNATIFLDSQNWMKYVKIDPNIILVYDKGTQGQEIYTQLTTNTMGVVKSKDDGKTDLAAFLITDEGKGSLRIKDSENELNISVDGITIKEGFYEYNISRSKIKDMATKSDLKGLATEKWVNDKGYITSIPDDYAKKTDIPNTSIETVTVSPSADTEYTLNSNKYLRVIPAADVKLTFNRPDGTGLMREYHILIDCKTAEPTIEFNGVIMWELYNEPVFEKGRLYDIVIRDDGNNMYGNCKVYKLLNILITTSDATDVQLNGTTYKLTAGDNSLTDVDLSTITQILGFEDDDNITSIDFDDSIIKIEDLHEKFSYMGNLTKISNIIVKYAKSLKQMFRRSRSLKEIDTSYWDVSNVTDFSSMFSGCNALTTLDLSKWNVSRAVNFTYMFSGCRSLETIDVSNWDVGGSISSTSSTNFSSMFRECTSLTSLDLSGWNMSKAGDFTAMFDGCSGLKTLDAPNLNLYGVVRMFYDCRSLTTLDVAKWNVSRATDFSSMFYDCNALTTLDLSKWNVSKAGNFTYMFYDCRSLTTLDLSKWNVSRATDLSSMFDGCSGLKTLDISGWNISASARITDMFHSCNALTTIKMIGCSQDTIDKINSVKPASATIITE